MVHSGRYVVAAFVSTVVLLGACSGEHPPTSGASGSKGSSALVKTTEADREDVLDELREGAKFVPWATPQELVAEQSVAVVGVVKEVFEGRSLISTSEGFTTRDNSVVVRVHVTRTLKDTEGLIRNETAYVSLPRGVNLLHSDGSVIQDDPNPSLDQVRRALPEGLRVAIVSEPDDSDIMLRHPSVKVGDEPYPLPDGATLLGGFHPQTFVVDRGKESVTGWVELTFDDLLRQLGG